MCNLPPYADDDHLRREIESAFSQAFGPIRSVEVHTFGVKSSHREFLPGVASGSYAVVEFSKESSFRKALKITKNGPSCSVELDGPASVGETFVDRLTKFLVASFPNPIEERKRVDESMRRYETGESQVC